jgi:hypothetical protein
MKSTPVLILSFLFSSLFFGSSSYAANTTNAPTAKGQNASIRQEQRTAQREMVRNYQLQKPIQMRGGPRVVPSWLEITAPNRMGGYTMERRFDPFYKFEPINVGITDIAVLSAQLRKVPDPSKSPEDTALVRSDMRERTSTLKTFVEQRLETTKRALDGIGKSDFVSPRPGARAVTSEYDSVGVPLYSSLRERYPIYFSEKERRSIQPEVTQMLKERIKVDRALLKQVERFESALKQDSNEAVIKEGVGLARLNASLNRKFEETFKAKYGPKGNPAAPTNDVVQ